jgi:hypothetical protein
MDCLRGSCVSTLMGNPESPWNRIPWDLNLQ